MVKKNQNKLFCDVKIMQNSSFSIQKLSFFATQLCQFIYILPMIIFELQGQSLVVVLETIQSTNLKYLLSDP